MVTFSYKILLIIDQAFLREREREMEKKSPTCIATLRAALRLTFIVVFLGYLMIWIVMPTHKYRQNWWPSIQKKADSTYFGLQGVRLLIYVLPVLFMAVLGGLYLHLGNNLHDDINFESNGKKHHMELWKRPMLVKGPLGIVSGIELTLLVMFMALLVWSFSTYLHNIFGLIIPAKLLERKEQEWQAKLNFVALMLGVTGNIGLAFLFFPVTRGSSLLPLFGLTSEASIKYHIWLGHIVMVLFTAHGLLYFVYWGSTNRISEVLKWQETRIANVPGEVSLLAGLALWATTHPRIRLKMFELFFYTHYLYILFMVFYLFHVGFTYACFMLPGFYLFLVDRYLRFLQSRQSVRLVSARILPCETVELNFSKTPSLKYNPTSIIFINVPSISKLQWHPFTINSNSNLEAENLSIVIKGEGSWSKKLYHMLSSPSSLERLEISVEGPYGPATTHFLRHDTIVMVSGGSGITPFISIIRELIFTSAILELKTPRVVLICAFKHSSELTMLDLLLPISGTSSAAPHLQLKIEAYVTREKEHTTDHSKLLQAIWFKPHPRDAPISAVLGPNCWLWLAAIISSSFISFLILIGIITRYYIYPIDHDTYRVYSLSLRTVLNILVFCISIAVTASAAVLWNKKQIAQKSKQFENVEGTTPTDSTTINADRELESLPSQSLMQATKVHYGERPDLKRLLLECSKGSDVGVLVCGPRNMRHEVATICSSISADNMHFELISFNW
ncbi:Ferric_reduct domain-containing protein/FAD_binding_8 domain-containing protein/NAD_binding_6 domain-containing protein [Cephalotus follicularis]|uniref:ferric-chelate reductase (NADH) n=1 Tax=Cephalotus follicularis TaxID=3775 RepID=A0A1Q3DCX6_CEPFO|nr:Ferric_reduct domain-containing protein/FAD_binding_8 domain-containing protein/NAD_binding_6 domain-containing protein [Cephalotus follicularis]